MPKTSEPVIAVSAVVIALEAIQASAIHMSSGVHALIGALIIGLGAIITRSRVTPTPAPNQ